jgi:hypothetical protein
VKTSLVVAAATVMVVVVGAERSLAESRMASVGVCHRGNSRDLLSFISSHILSRHNKTNIYDSNIVYLYLSARKVSSSKLPMCRRTGPNNVADQSQASTFGKTRNIIVIIISVFVTLISSPLPTA